MEAHGWILEVVVVRCSLLHRHVKVVIIDEEMRVLSDLVIKGVGRGHEVRDVRLASLILHDLVLISNRLPL